MSGGIVLGSLQKVLRFGGQGNKACTGAGEQLKVLSASSSVAEASNDPPPAQPPAPAPGAWPPPWFILMGGEDDPPETLPSPQYDGRTTLPDAGWGGLLSRTQVAFYRLERACKKSGLKIVMDEGYRPRRRQAYLYSLGRKPQPDGSWAVMNEGAKVTNALPGKSKHQSRMAFDLRVNGGYEDSLLAMVGLTAQKQGLVWGGTWHDFPDPDHFEMKAES